VPPKACLIVLMSPRDVRAQAYRRCLPICPLSEDLAAGRADGANLM